MLLGGTGGSIASPPASALFPGELTPAEEAEAARKAAASAFAARSGRNRQGRPTPGMAPESPIPFTAGMLSPYGVSWPQAPAPAASGSVDAPAPDRSTVADLPPSTNDPASGEPVLFENGVPLPRPRPPTVTPDGVDIGPGPNAPFSMAPTEGDGDRLPPGATPTGPQPLPTAAPPGPQPVPGGLGQLDGILGKIFNPANAPLLLALGGGLAGAPSLGTGMRRGFSQAAPAAALLRKEQVDENSIRETYKALVGRGIPAQEALAAVRNPDIMKAVVGKYFETKPLTVHMIKDPLGGETPVVFNPSSGKFMDMAGNPIGKQQLESGGVAGGGIPGGVLAPGATFDPQATGEAYLAQFNDDVKAAVRAYINGDVQPTGNPRQRSLASFAKQVAQRYGQDMGIPVSDTIFAERRQYRQQLGSNSATAAGGQAKAFNQGIEHAHALAEKLKELKNKDPLGIPRVAAGVNWVREAFSTKQAGIAAEARTIGQTLAGEVGKLFSGSAGGGVHEREMTRDRFNTVSSPQELAAALSGTLETMEGGLKALEQRRDQILGPNNNVEFVNKETRQKIAEIRQIIAELRGAPPAAHGAATGAATPTAPTAAPAPGRYILDPAGSGRLVPAR